MVVQRETSATFWGWAQPGEKVAITGSWGATAAATTAADGTWKLKLKTPKAGGPFQERTRGMRKQDIRFRKWILKLLQATKYQLLVIRGTSVFSG
jgi:hypothetical protein